MKTKLLTIEGKQIGIVGLDEVLKEFYQTGEKPNEGLKNRLLNRLKQLNYIPSAKEEAYSSVFLEEYAKFCDRQTERTEEETKDLGTWRGIPREEIPWYPTILEDLCDGCKLCVQFCSFGVYEYDEKNNKVRVTNPFNCVVGCSMCALKCKPKAIMFPPLSILETYREE
jgi:NAD-dependent dihydropyrimidine dehydrogenase PreA subunit